MIPVPDLESFLHFGNALSDESSIDRMPDSYGLQLFLFANCLDCMEKDDDVGLLHLLPWDLQDEVIRSPTSTRKERFEKDVLILSLLLHYFDLSFLPRSQGVTQRFHERWATPVTFAEHSTWPRTPNDSLVLIHFTIHAPKDWSFSRSGPAVSRTSVDSCAKAPMAMRDPEESFES
jgi:hypothetical protein